MKLTPQQLEYIRSFISKRGFTALDLQMEIIDHVACRAEDILTENPAVSFEEAVTRTHREFGVFRFSTLEEAMTKSLSRKYRNQLALEIKRWFSFNLDSSFRNSRSPTYPFGFRPACLRLSSCCSHSCSPRFFG